GYSWKDGVMFSDSVPVASGVSVTFDGNKAKAVYTYTDSSNLAESGSTYAWERGTTGSETTGTDLATNATSYSLSADENAKYLRFCITPKNGRNNGDKKCSDWTSVGHLVGLYKDASYSGTSAHFAYEQSASGTCYAMSSYLSSLDNNASSYKFNAPSG